MAASDPTTGVATPTGVLQGVAAFSWDGTTWQPSAGAGPDVATPTGVLRGVAPFLWDGASWQPPGRAQPGVAARGGVLDGVAVYTWSGSAWMPASGNPSTPGGALRGVAAFNWDGSAWQPVGHAGPGVATPYGVLDGVAMFNWTGSAWAAEPGPALDISFMTPGDLDARLTFTRASTATCFNSGGVMQTAASGAPRWDYDPVALTLRGLLIEEARTNIALNSGNPAAWGAGTALTITSNAGVVPDGTNSATRLVDTATAGQHTTNTPGEAITANTAYTFSIYAKQAGRPRIQLIWYNNSFANSIAVTFDLTAGTAGGIVYTGTASGGASSITPVGNGWYRCAVSGIVDASSTTAFGFIYLDNGSGNSYTGDGVSGLLVWGGQVEAGAFSTSYVPTTAATVTRAADVCSSALGAWYVQQPGTLAVEALQPVACSKLVRWLGAENAGAATAINVNAANSVAMFDTTGALNTTVGAEPVGTVFKAAFAFANGAQSIVLNAGAPVTGTSATLTSGLTTLDIGCQASSATLQTNGYVRRARYWPRALSTAELQAATT